MSPPLSVSDVPEGARSLVLIMEDPDVPRNLREDGMWDHWIVYNIPPDWQGIEEGEEPPGDHGTGTAGNTNYYGPCPPDREHRYFFKLFALDTAIEAGNQPSKDEVLKAMDGHVLESAELLGFFAPPE